VAVALAESCIAGQLGAEINLGLTKESLLSRWDEVLFGECASRILVAVSSQQQADWESYLKEQLGEQLQYSQALGIVKSKEAGLHLLIADNLPLIDVSITDISDRFSSAIERRLTL
jgi:phosphoribosylformylglycinamidine synthase